MRVVDSLFLSCPHAWETLWVVFEVPNYMATLPSSCIMYLPVQEVSNRNFVPRERLGHFQLGT